MPTDPYTPRQSLENALKYWWLITVCIVLGGAAGWLFSRIRTPVYEARAGFHLEIDPEAELDLTSFEQDQIILGAASLSLSTPVLERVVELARQEGIDIDIQTLNERIGLERRLSNWTLIVRYEDPEASAALANLWGEQTLEALKNAHQHALRAEALTSYQAALQSCLEATTDGEDAPEACLGLDLAELKEEIQRAADEIQQETLAGQGVFPALIFDLTRQAAVPQQPQQFGTNALVLAGGFIGLVIGIILVNIGAGQSLRR